MYGGTAAAYPAAVGLIRIGWGDRMKPLIDIENLSEPPARMVIKVSRRGMLNAAADAAEEKHRSGKGLPSYAIEDLAAYDEKSLASICPIVNRKARILLEKGMVLAETSASVDPLPLFGISSPALYIFNQFNGMQTIAEINDNVAEYTGWDSEKAARIVRAVFIKLCEVRVCEPG